jgi:hypothetical protein
MLSIALALTVPVLADIPAITAPPMTGAGPTVLGARSYTQYGRRNRPRFRTAPNGRRPRGAKGRQIMYRIQVEKATGYPLKEFAKEVRTILDDKRGWQGTGRVYFQQRRRAQFRIILATPLTVDRMCAPLDTNGYVSCYRKNKVILNVMRWREGAAAWKGKLLDYRRYLINHEVGHALGRRHEYCNRAGGLVPVMHPQTYGFMNCKPNYWPLMSEKAGLR